MFLIITVDGPAGAGKSTVAKLLAERLNISYLDSGAIYRTLTLACILKKADVYDEEKVLSVLRSVKMEFKEEIREGKKFFACYLDGRDVSTEIRKKEVSSKVSVVAKHPRVREAMIPFQRAFAEKHDVVCDGRDMGSFVFSEADFKFFLTADPLVRAERRYKELIENGLEVSFEEVLQNITYRDSADSTREASPLVPAPDAVLIDTTHLKPEEVVDMMISLIERSEKK